MPAKKTMKPKPATSKVAKPITAVKLKSTVTKPKPATTKTAKNTLASTRDTKPKPLISKAVKPERTDVFVSYSHADKKWLNRLEVHLKPLERDHEITIWADTKLRGGDKWRAEIDKALAKAKVAIMLVSADFMASDFIANNELPPLLKAAEKDGVLILSVIVGDSGGFSVSGLSQFQAMNAPSLPLNMMSEGQADQVFTQLFRRVYDFFVAPVSKPISRTATKSKEAGEQVIKQSSAVISEKKTTVRVTGTSTKKNASSPSKVNKVLLVNRSGDWDVVTVTQSSLANDLTLTLKATNPAQRIFLTSLRQNDQLSSVVLGNQTYICTSSEIQVKTLGTHETWYLALGLQQQNRRAQITYSGITPAIQAEARARLLLLNEPLPSDQTLYRHFGSNTIVDFDASPLPALYHRVNKQAASFKETAPLISTWFLQINNIVEHISKLTFSIRGDKLTVQFEGQRSSQYQAESPAIIKVVGICDLSKSTGEKGLKLGPLSRY